MRFSSLDKYKYPINCLRNILKAMNACLTVKGKDVSNEHFKSRRKRSTTNAVADPKDVAVVKERDYDVHKKCALPGISYCNESFHS